MNTATRALRQAARQGFSTRGLPQNTNSSSATQQHHHRHLHHHHHHRFHPQTLRPALINAASSARSIHTSRKDRAIDWPTSPEPRSHPNRDNKPAIDENIGRKRFGDFNVTGKVFVVTGAAQGLGLAMAEALVEAGGKVYALDRSPEADEQWQEAMARVEPAYGAALLYRQQDPRTGGWTGSWRRPGVQQVTPALDYTPEDVARMLDINYTGVFKTAQSAARQMFKYKTRGSICLIASMSGLIANKGLLSPVYNSSKAAVIQLGRNLAMEWSPVREDGSGGIRVNCISPGHILTPMVRKNFEEVPGLRETWEAESMMGRLAETAEFKGAVLSLLSNASSFMTGNNLVIDGGHTAW
ncbi:hypothetical protein VTG60DRAFT_4566 [Thermothelomyces hinnuleus]